MKRSPMNPGAGFKQRVTELRPGDKPLTRTPLNRGDSQLTRSDLDRNPNPGRGERGETPQQSRRKAQLRDWAEVKQQAAQRDGFRCVGCGSDQQLETHHRHLKQAGGSKLHDNIANALTLCRAHHEYAHAHRNTDAIALGWCVLQGEDPAVYPIRAYDGFLYLHGDDGERRRVG